MIQPRYIDNIYARKYLRFIEWKAVLRLVYDCDSTAMSIAFPVYNVEVVNWYKNYTSYIERNVNSSKAKNLQVIYLDLLADKIANLDEFYLRLTADFTNLKLTKSFKNKNNGSAKGSGNNQAPAEPELACLDNATLSCLIIKTAVASANTNYTPTVLREVVNALALEHFSGHLTHEQLAVLFGIFTRKVNAMEKSITKPEATILRHPIKKLAKNAYHLFGLFKLQCEVGDTWELPLTELAKDQLGVGTPTALEAVDLLIKLKLIEISESIQQQNRYRRFTAYKRLK